MKTLAMSGAPAVLLTIASLSLTAVMPAQAALGDPELIIYRFPGVRDFGGAPDTGVATVFHCTNFSGVGETIRIVVRAADGTLKANIAENIGHLTTFTIGTHNTVLYLEDRIMVTGALGQGTVAIAATSVNIICTAMTIDAASASPVGIALRGIRFNPAPGSQE